ncbi:LacI family transcriptional regulator [Streptomyces scopuliridis]|uniref:LacI family transcriptional regulator n=1 Tax=Streptomyces scopuliridis TaxID=452529 RepID=A0ACD4ZTD3_9ACTN|nr:LacI family DNA-binding transcriptional regulator [Streptomyces scopuliridis]WSC01480.1 LacI family transcriptional regulator [Streptomyces scopuliridis]WSC04983.1 LacI family transcriptional regulator [Streptomyces scopuliridis]
MAPTLTDVAKRANVALSTASRAFSDPDRLGPQTLRKVLAVAQELGYEPPVARLAEPPAEGETATVAVVVPDIANPVFGAFVKAAQGEGWHRRQTVVLADTDLSPDREREVIAHMRDRADGLIVCSPRLEAEEILDICGRTPVVLVNRETTGADCVIADAAHGMRQAVEYLAALGHRRIAYVQGMQRSWSNAHRVELIRAETERAGLGLELLGWQAETVAGGTAAAASVMASGASAVITHNDLMAFGVIAGARALGLAVPEDLSVIGVDDIPFAEVSQPSLTSIAVPMAKAGALSLDLLGQIIAGERQTPRMLRLPTQLIVRGSSGPAASHSSRQEAAVDRAWEDAS